MVHFPFATMQGLIMKQMFLAMPDAPLQYNEPALGRSDSALSTPNRKNPCWLWERDFKLQGLGPLSGLSRECVGPSLRLTMKNL